jgi:ribosomal protein L27
VLVHATYHHRATKKQGGSTKNKKGSLPKYLGAKMSGGQLAFPGQVLVTQRGTNFHPGHNVGVVSCPSDCCTHRAPLVLYMLSFIAHAGQGEHPELQQPACGQAGSIAACSHGGSSAELWYNGCC